MPPTDNASEHKQRSFFFARIFDALGIQYSVKPKKPEVIDNNKVLKCHGQSLQLYFNLPVVS